MGVVRAPQVHFLLNSFEDGHGCFLPPPGTAPHVVANVLKAFFSTLPEPLLTYKCGRCPHRRPHDHLPPHPAVRAVLSSYCTIRVAADRKRIGKAWCNNWGRKGLSLGTQPPRQSCSVRNTQQP